MPGTLKVRVLAARDLPVMDRASDTADAFVEIKFGQTVFKTEVFPKSLNPVWNSDWFTFEAEDEELQDEALQFRVMDYDTYSANDAVGRVYLDLTPLLTVHGPSQIAGWLPIYDTLHGIRGELNIAVKVNHFADFSQFRQSSCGIEVFASSTIPYGYALFSVHGFVEDLIANNDPEHDWLDKIRTPRASNETRQALFSKMAGELMRRIGRKVLEVGGNAVIGYSQCFDFEGELGVVIRGSGTAVTMEAWQNLENTPMIGVFGERFNFCLDATNLTLSERCLNASMAEFGVATPAALHRPQNPSPSPCSAMATAGAATSGSALTSFINTPVPKLLYGKRSPAKLPVSQAHPSRLMEHSFLTLRVFPPGFVKSLGGVVCSHSVKLLHDMGNDDKETRDQWWQELRLEIRSHMKALTCNVVLGYKEQSSLCEDVCILSAMGTAALVDLAALQNCAILHGADDLYYKAEMDSSSALNSELNLNDRRCHKNLCGTKCFCRLIGGIRRRQCTDKTFFPHGDGPTSAKYFCMKTDVIKPEINACTACHVPYSSIPFPVKLSPCNSCGTGIVPDILMATTDPLPDLVQDADFRLVQATVVRKKQGNNGESLAKELSNILPFVEHDLHSQLIQETIAHNKNSIFCLQHDIVVGEDFVVVRATGTAMTLPSLSMVSYEEEITPRRANNSVSSTSKPEYKPPPTETPIVHNSEIKVKENQAHELNLSWDRAAVLVEYNAPKSSSMPIFDSAVLPSCSNAVYWNPAFVSECRYLAPKMCVRILRFDFDDENFNEETLTESLFWMVKSTLYKFRKMSAIGYAGLTFHTHLSQSGEIQLAMTGVALFTENLEKTAEDNDCNDRATLSHAFAPKSRHYSGQLVGKDRSSRLANISMSDSHLDGTAHDSVRCSVGTEFCRSSSWSQLLAREIFLTPLVSPVFTNVKAYLGYFNFFFIRETTSYREIGGLEAFVHSSVTEIFHVVQAHVAASGGHGILSFKVTVNDLSCNPGRNQAQFLLGVSGDIVTTA